jgi:hypothetical protein
VKVTLDLSKLVEEEKLSPAEAERLRALAAHDGGSYAQLASSSVSELSQ